MGRYGIFPATIGSSHKRNLTPHVAITLFGSIQFLIPTAFILLSYAHVGGWQMLPFDAFNDAGLFGAMGFCAAYVLISLATPFYLKKIGEMKAHHIAIAVIAIALLAVPIVGTVYPEPAPPANYFSYIFIAYLLIGVAVVSIRSRSVVEMDGIRKVLDETTMVPGMTALPGAALSEAQLRSMSAGAGGAD
jgi:amino acid transporter